MAKTQRQKLVKQLDDIVREILRKKYPNVCVVCGKVTDWFHPQNNPKGLQVGHYISRRFMVIKWDLKNVHPQCSSCNWLHNSDPVPYTQFMLKTYGQAGIDELEAIRRHVVKWSTPHLQEKLEELTVFYNGL